MVGREQDRVLLGGEPEQRRAQHQLRREVERRERALAHQTRQLRRLLLNRALERSTTGRSTSHSSSTTWLGVACSPHTSTVRSASWRSNTVRSAPCSASTSSGPVDAPRERRVVRHAPRRQLVEEQQLLLRERQRVAPRGRRSGLHGARRVRCAVHLGGDLRRRGRGRDRRAVSHSAIAASGVDRRRELPQRGLLEQRPHRDVDLAALAHLRDHARREQRMAAEVEEVVIRPDTLDRRGPSARPPRPSSRSPSRAPAKSAATSASQLGAGRARRSILPLRVSGMRSSSDRSTRGPCSREALSACERAARRAAPRSPTHRRARRPRPRRPRGACRRAPPRSPRPRSRSTPRVLADRALDLAELDPEAADLDLVVGPAAEVELAVGQARSYIAGPVEPSRPERVLDEPLGSQLRPVQVAAGHARAADVQLAGHAARNRHARCDRARTRSGRGSARPIGLVSRSQSAALSGR